MMEMARHARTYECEPSDANKQQQQQNSQASEEARRMAFVPVVVADDLDVREERVEVNHRARVLRFVILHALLQRFEEVLVAAVVASAVCTHLREDGTWRRGEERRRARDRGGHTHTSITTFRFFT
jgi:hypothetical protein